MKKIFSIVMLLCLVATMVMAKLNLKVLYLGGSSDWSNGEMGDAKYFKTDAEYKKSVEDRTKAFGDLLRQYFTVVKCMPAKEWKPEMSNSYDVTIFDGRPAELTPRVIERDSTGRVTKYQKPTYLPANYSAASIMIGELSDVLGRSIGSKNDWYCLCLDANAHSMKLDHPIFKGPFKTKITLRKEPTPEPALHEYFYLVDYPVPDSVKMWRVNTKGYETDKGFRVGMVSRPWGYTDSPDCEWISSGVCAKSIDAVALGRHANLFHWGFVGSPLYMTPEAKVVFANTVAYMAKHKGAPLVRKYEDLIYTRECIRETEYLATRKSWISRIHSDSIFYQNMLVEHDSAVAKKARGEELSGTEQRMLNYTADQIPPTMTYADYLKRYQKDLYNKFGDDESAYLRYWKEARPYLYGGEGRYNPQIDEDAKAWQIPTNDKRLLDKAITCMEKGVDTERANRILHRYTLCRFSTPKEWRDWYTKYQNKMFFTESGGYFFMINDRNAPGNDYSVIKK